MTAVYEKDVIELLLYTFLAKGLTLRGMAQMVETPAHCKKNVLSVLTLAVHTHLAAIKPQFVKHV